MVNSLLLALWKSRLALSNSYLLRYLFTKVNLTADQITFHCDNYCRDCGALSSHCIEYTLCPEKIDENVSTTR